MAKKKLSLGIHKLTSPTHRIEFYGRDISKGSWKFAPKHYDKILKLKRRVFKAELAQVAHLAK